ncbi:unnamed protein product [Ostreobium quekettii]|uniref:DUF3593 domain-containing protein n=1 Tax=Ostreobium quekettii TaxID=121088 RepID=A0A8S1J0N2_9CHLO|nr:unnamed protein product [Ostreobium quekettii]
MQLDRWLRTQRAAVGRGSPEHLAIEIAASSGSITRVPTVILGKSSAAASARPLICPGHDVDAGVRLPTRASALGAAASSLTPSSSCSPAQGPGARRRWPEIAPPFAASCSSSAQDLALSPAPLFEGVRGGQLLTRKSMMRLMWTGVQSLDWIPAPTPHCSPACKLHTQEDAGPPGLPSFFGRSAAVAREKGRGGLRALPFDTAWAPNVSTESLAPGLFAFSIVPYAGFLYHLTRSKQAPPVMLFGFYFLLVFVGVTIPAGIYAKSNFGTSLANVDWLHGGAESLLTITNLLIVWGLRQGIRDAEAKKIEQVSELVVEPESKAER